MTSATEKPPVPLISADTKITLTVLVLAAMIMILNETSLSVALTPIMMDFAIPATTAQWLVTGFMLTMAVVIPTSGYLLQRLSTRRLFFGAVALFLTGTVLAAVAPAFIALLVGRVIQASGTACMIPLLMTVTMTLVPPQRRGSVMGIITVVISVAPALGPTVGGFIIGMLSWHYVFWCMVPLMLLVLALGVWKLPNAGETRRIPLDIWSVILSACAFGGLVYGFTSINRMLEGAGVEIIITALGCVAMVIFVRRQLRLAQEGRALLNLRAFGHRNFTITLTVMLLAFGMLIACFTILPIYLETSLLVSAQVAGLVVLPGGLIQGLISPVVGRLFDAHGPRPLLIPGIFMLATSLWLMSTLQATSPVWMVMGMHMLLAAGMGLLITPLMTTALSSLPGDLYGYGSAIVSTLQQLVGAAGTALLVVFLTRGIHAGLGRGWAEPEATALGVHWAFLFAGVVGTVACALALLVKRVPVQH